MGRYYNGDINGKFWFGVLPSNAHERFGAVEYDSGYINYEISRDSYEDIVQTLLKIESTTPIQKIKNYFDSIQGYNDDMLKKENITQEMLYEYASYQLGKQVKDFFDEHPDIEHINFEAEC